MDGKVIELTLMGESAFCFNADGEDKSTETIYLVFINNCVCSDRLHDDSSRTQDCRATDWLYGEVAAKHKYQW